MQVYYLELFLPVSDSVLAETLLASLPKGLTLYPKEWNYSSWVFHPENRWDTVSAIQPVGTRNYFIGKLNYDVAWPFSSKIHQEAHCRQGRIQHESPVELRWEGRLPLCLYTAEFSVSLDAVLLPPILLYCLTLEIHMETMKDCKLMQNSSSLALTQAPPVPKWSLQYYRHGSYQTAAPINVSPSLLRWLTHLYTVIGRRGRETEILETYFKNLLLQSYATLLLHEDQLSMLLAGEEDATALRSNSGGRGVICPPSSSSLMIESP